ncbi:MAG: 2-dehydropantoate 2-reductase [Gemmatimonadota bacterium]
MRIGVVGAGGAGGHFAARWRDIGHDVTVVARGDHGRALDAHGLRLRSPLGDTHVRPGVVSSVADLGEVDCVVFATKSFQLHDAANGGLSLRGPSVAFGLQNGVSSARVLKDALPFAVVLGATCRVISLIESPGVIRHVGSDPEIVVGAQSATLSNVSRDVASDLNVEGKLSVISSDRIDYEIWNKFLFFAPVSGVGSVSRLTIGAFRADPDWRRMLESAIEEVATIADAVGVPLGDDAVERTLQFVDGLPANGTSSLHRDIEEGRANELNDLSGRVVELGRELGIDTPTHAEILESLHSRGIG